MRRILVFLRWKSKNWLQRGDQSIIASLMTCQYQLEGFCAYAFWQAHIFEALHEHFTGIWSSLELPRERLTDQIYPVRLDSDLMELDGDDV